jgi:hypothetical protein
VQSSFSAEMLANEHISSSANGLVCFCWKAYSNHHHLTLRPEDIWFAIVSQIGFHVNQNHKSLHHLFVEHEGRKELVVSDVRSLDFGAWAERMSLEIQENVVDPDLREWIMPDFSTTTDSDRVVASVLMMGATQKWMYNTPPTTCGLPSVTLLGEKEDWVKLQSRISKLKTFGPEPKEFAKLLKPVMRYFVACFDDPPRHVVEYLWSSIVHFQNDGSGSSYLLLWITAFCFWTAEGTRTSAWGRGSQLDGAMYPRICTADIPAGYASVPLKIDDNGEKVEARMVADSVGFRTTSGGQSIAESTGGLELGSVQPISGWWVFKPEERARR